MVIGKTRAGRLANTASLLVCIGLSCRYQVGLPGPADDAGGGSVEADGAQGSDVPVDQSGPNDKAGSSHPDECANPRFLGAQANAVEMIIALDRSTTMQKETFGSATRWQAARQAILASTAAHPSIQFGIEQFPSLKDCGGPTCCADWVLVQPYHSTNIADQLACGLGDAGCPGAGDNSPSHLALRQCREHFLAEVPQGRSADFVLLITDKDPSCAGEGSPDGSPCDQAVNEASKLGKNLGVQTFVVALNSDGHSPDCLTNIAAASASNFPGNTPQLLVATNEDELSTQLETVMALAEANVCRFPLGRTPDDPAQVSVTIGHQHVPFDVTGTQGWSFSDATASEVVLSGSYCNDLLSAPGNAVPQVTDCQQ